ncbi:MAG: hypothetical protein H6841_06915 [Planctomycetes bacterium]|nr:hypothetical protein [Planctomycetota bacterium]MCB9935297.1 hypothetical protein [Planctomycetota bacterium]
MKYAIAILLLFLACRAFPVRAQAPTAAPRGMSAVDIVDALVSPDAALRDRGSSELATMSMDTGEQVGIEITRVGVREAESALSALGVADTAACAAAACAALDSKEGPVRIAALDALALMTPAHVSEGGAKHLNAGRLEVMRKLVAESDFVKLACEGLPEDGDGALVAPVHRAMGLVTLLDRFFGVRGVPLLMKRIAHYMLGEEPGDEAQKTDVQRGNEERLRRGAALWCEAIWIENPAIIFNYTPLAPYADRAKAVARLNKVLDEMEKAEVELGNKTTGIQTFKGKRYGDYLFEVAGNSDVTGNRWAALLRLRWWSGEDVVIQGEGFAEAVEALSKLRPRQRTEIRSRIEVWWKNHRLATE